MDTFRCDTVHEAMQAAFTGAVRGLHSQGWKPCVDKHGNCLWNLGKPGVHCAVGWLISWKDQVRVDAGLHHITNALRLLHPELRRHVNDDSFQTFLTNLQDTHDEAGTPEMAQSFMAFGEANGLMWPSDIPFPGGTS